MKKNFAISAGISAAILLGGIAIALPYFEKSISPQWVLVAMVALVFGASVAALTQQLATAPAKKVTWEKLGRTKLADVSVPTEDNERRLITPIPSSSEALKLVIKPWDKPKDILPNLTKYREHHAFVTLKQNSKETSFNPVYLRDIFKALKENENSISVLLRDENDEYAGYIPGAVVRTKFVDSENAVSEITTRILDYLANPSEGFEFRKMGGMASTDWISDQSTVIEAARRMTRDQLKSLVILENGRHRKPCSVIYLEEIAAAMVNT